MKCQVRNQKVKVVVVENNISVIQLVNQKMLLSRKKGIKRELENGKEVVIVEEKREVVENVVAQIQILISHEERRARKLIRDREMKV